MAKKHAFQEIRQHGLVAGNWKWQSKREPARQPKRGPVYGWVTRGVREALVSTLKAYLTVLGGTQGAQNGRFRTYSADGFDRRILAT